MFESNCAETSDRSRGDCVDADQRLTYRYATAEDLIRFYGERPAQTIRAVVVLKGETPVVVMGIANRNDCATLFSDYTPEAYELRHSLTILRAVKKVMQLVQESKRTVYAVRQDGTDMLVRLGFEHVSDEVYRWPS